MGKPLAAALSFVAHLILTHSPERWGADTQSFDRVGVLQKSDHVSYANLVGAARIRNTLSTLTLYLPTYLVLIWIRGCISLET